MAKFLSNLVWLMVCLMIFEYNLYVKDRNELLIMCKYVIHDINNSDLKSFYSDKFEVIVSEESGNGIVYQITMKRDSLFNIKKLKTIKYRGLIN